MTTATAAKQVQRTELCADCFFASCGMSGECMHPQKSWTAIQSSRDDPGQKCTVMARDCSRIAACTTATDAAFIVTACNAHDYLVAALEALADAVETSKPEHAGYLAKCAQDARTALAKVQS